MVIFRGVSKALQYYLSALNRVRDIRRAFGPAGAQIRHLLIYPLWDFHFIYNALVLFHACKDVQNSFSAI